VRAWLVTGGAGSTLGPVERGRPGQDSCHLKTLKGKKRLAHERPLSLSWRAKSQILDQAAAGEEIASFILCPDKARAGLFPEHSRSRILTVDEIRGLLGVTLRNPMPLFGKRLRPRLDSGDIRVFTAGERFTFGLDLPGFRAASFLIPLFLLFLFFPFTFLKGGFRSLSHYSTP